MLEDTNTSPTFVITAKKGKQIVFLQKALSRFVEHWLPKVNDYTYRFGTRKEANEILDIQVDYFPERNTNLTSFKVKQIKSVLTIK